MASPVSLSTFSGKCHPFGQMRTWPNAVTREYCKAQLDGRQIFQPKTFVTSAFVNMVAGPIDQNLTWHPAAEPVC